MHTVRMERMHLKQLMLKRHMLSIIQMRIKRSHDTHAEAAHDAHAETAHQDAG